MFKPKLLLSPDAPTESWHADGIGREDLVARLINLLVTGVVPGQPLPVVALTGPLGSGKTSVLKLLQLQLEEDHRDVIPVYFSAWLPAAGASFTAQLLGSIEDAVSKRYIVPLLTHRMRRFASIISGSLSDRFRHPLDRFLSDKSQTEQIEQLCRSLELLPAPVLVLVDELDRMQADELHALFKILRGIPQQKNLRFLCALDIDHVARTLAGAAGPGNAKERTRERLAYLDKFFACVVPLPEVEPTEWRECCAEAIRYVIQREHASHSPGADEIEATVRSNWGNYAELFATPRRAKMVLNRFHDRVHMLAEECHIGDLFHLSALEIVAPEIVGIVRQEQWYFVDTETYLPQHFIIEMAARNEEGRDERREEFFESKLKPRTAPLDLSQRLLSELFPEVKKWMRDGKVARRRLDSEQDVRSRHIWLPHYFGVYFCGRASYERLSESERIALLRDLKAAVNVEQAADRICKAIDAPRRLYLCLQGILDEPGLGSIARHGFIQAAIRLPGEELHAENFERMLNVVSLVEEAVRTLSLAERDDACMALIEGCTDVGLLSGLARLSRNPGDFPKVRYDLIAARMRRDFFPGSDRRSLLEFEDPELVVCALEEWGRCGEEAIKDLKEYLKSEFNRDPRLAAQLIYCLRQRRVTAKVAQAIGLADRFYGSARDLLAIAESVKDLPPGVTMSLEQFRSDLDMSSAAKNGM